MTNRPKKTPWFQTRWAVEFRLPSMYDWKALDLPPFESKDEAVLCMATRAEQFRLPLESYRIVEVTV